MNVSDAGAAGGSFGVGPYALPKRAPALIEVLSQNRLLPRGLTELILASAHACQLLQHAAAVDQRHLAGVAEVVDLRAAAARRRGAR